jgi:hypothetical protein
MATWVLIEGSRYPVADWKEQRIDSKEDQLEVLGPEIHIHGKKSK